MYPGRDERRLIEASISPRMRCTGPASKRGSVIAKRSRRTASSRLRLSVFKLPRKVS